MKVKYNAPKGQRFKRRFTWITCQEQDVWFTGDSLKTMKFSKNPLAFKDSFFSTSQDCHSIKAFKRRVARMDKSLVGVTFQLSHIFYNTKVKNRLYYSAFITKKK
jgi:hypothetical protein